jgi:hypothetical protein
LKFLHEDTLQRWLPAEFHFTTRSEGMFIDVVRIRVRLGKEEESYLLREQINNKCAAFIEPLVQGAMEGCMNRKH